MLFEPRRHYYLFCPEGPLRRDDSIPRAVFRRDSQHTCVVLNGQPEPLDVSLEVGDDFVARMNKAVFAALKPGGTYIVIDHSAGSNMTPEATNKLHRVSPDVVKKEVMAAGFKLESESPLLAHAEDNHTSPVFDGAVRGKTDSFLLKFRKP